MVCLYSLNVDMKFVQENSKKIKRFLEYKSDNVAIANSDACRNKLFPSVIKEKRGTGGNTHPSWAGEEFFAKVNIRIRL